MKHAIRSLSLVLTLLTCATTSAQEAPEWGDRDEEARSLFEAGALAYRDGHYADAEQYFRRSYELSQRPALLYNIASAAERARHDRAALDAYEAFLRAVPDSDQRTRVEVRIRALRELSPSSSAERGVGAEPWIVVGTGAALAVVGGVLVGVAVADVSAVENAEMLSRWSAVADAYERSEPLSIAGFVLLGVGVAAATAGLLWALIPGGSDDSESAALRLRVGLAALSLEGAL